MLETSFRSCLSTANNIHKCGFALGGVWYTDSKKTKGSFLMH